MWFVATSKQGVKTFTLPIRKIASTEGELYLACSQCQKAKCEQVICLKYNRYHMGPMSDP